MSVLVRIGTLMKRTVCARVIDILNIYKVAIIHV
jgi:hypothetical protein